MDGAVALLGPSFGDQAWGEVADVPMLKGAKRTYDLQGMRELLEHLSGLTPAERAHRRPLDVMVVIERQQAMPKQGVTSTFSIGMGYGLWLGLIAGLQLPYRVVQAQAWKKALMAGEPRTKQASVGVALRLYPRLRGSLVGPKGGLKDGRADALLLAHYARSGH